MQRTHRSGRWSGLVLLATLCGCKVVPMADRAPAVVARPVRAIDPQYVRSGPVPHASLTLAESARGYEIWKASLPSKAQKGAPPEAVAPIGMRWWKPRANDGATVRRPAIVISPILGSDTAFVTQFAERFVAEGWHAIVVFHPEVTYDPARPFVQIEERLADSVSRRIEVVDWLLARDDVDPARIGSFGISAGGIEAALASGADHRYAAHVIGLAGGPLSDVFVDSDEGQIRRATAAAERAVGGTREDLRRRLAATIRTDTLVLAAKAPRESVLLILARHDHSVPTKTGKALYEALGRPRTIWLPLGHYASVLFLPFVTPRVLDFFRERFDAVRNGATR